VGANKGRPTRSDSVHQDVRFARREINPLWLRVYRGKLWHKVFAVVSTEAHGGVSALARFYCNDKSR
jgi:hypothetical protein